MVQLILSADNFQVFVDLFPKTLYKVKKLIGFDKDQFIKYVCCPKCNKLYKYSDAIYIDRHGLKHSVLCNNVKFPNHPQEKMRAPCKEALMKEVIAINGK